MAKTHTVKVVILDGPGSGGCGCGGPAAGTPEYTLMIQSRGKELRDALEKNFPGRTTIEYRNIVDHPEERNTPAGQILVNRTYPPPLVVIDGEPRFAGSIQVAKVVEAVGTLLGT